MDKSLEPQPAPSAPDLDWGDRRFPTREPEPEPAPTPAGTSTAGGGLRTLVEHLEVGLLAEDDHGRVRLLNQRFCELLCEQVEPDTLARRPAGRAARHAARQLCDPGDFLSWCGRVRREGCPVSGHVIERVDGRLISLSYTPVAEGAVRHLWQCREVTEQHRAQERLRALAQTDELTGLPNRRHVLDELGREIARFRRAGRPASVLMIDVDGFKQINDSHGHARGDRALCDLAAVLARRCRAADTAARLGGDEFLLILPETGRAGCCDIAERLMREIRVGGRGRLRVSIGATTLAGSDAHVDSVLARVDRGLYAAKEGGRDCVRYVAADPGADPEAPSAAARLRATG